MVTRTLNVRYPDSGFLSWKLNARREQIEISEFLTMGRDLANHVILEDTFASLRHARIERKSNGFLIRDLRSRNGTYVNGARVLEAMLGDGDRIRVGETEFDFASRRVDESSNALPTSKNPAWAAQLARLGGIAQSPFPVLLTGPSGTGKDVLAQAIHQSSTRRAGPFVSVNCSALTDSLVESELFGHLRGSFTGATGDRKGAFEAARGGTLFLDEIGDLPLSLQPKLLRALENNQIRPVGSDRAIETDVRILAATHQDLKRAVSEERFRSDLWFRLHVIQLQIPALKDRPEDFEDLFYFFARQMRVRFSFGAIQKLKGHTFPGNIRELRNIVARAKAYCPDREIVEDDVNQLLDVMPVPLKVEVLPADQPPRSIIKEIEQEMIKTRLVANKGNQRKTAADLGLPKSTLHDRIRTYGIDLKDLLRF